MFAFQIRLMLLIKRSLLIFFLTDGLGKRYSTHDCRCQSVHISTSDNNFHWSRYGSTTESPFGRQVYITFNIHTSILFNAFRTINSGERFLITCAGKSHEAWPNTRQYNYYKLMNYF